MSKYNLLIVNVVYKDTDFHIRKASVGKCVAICINMTHQSILLDEPQIVNECRWLQNVSKL